MTTATEVIFRCSDLALAREIYKNLPVKPMLLRPGIRLEFMLGAPVTETIGESSSKPAESDRRSVKQLTKEWLTQATQEERDLPRGDQLQALIEFAGHEECFLNDDCPSCRRIKGSGVRCLQNWQNTRQFCPVSRVVREQRGQHEEIWHDAMQQEHNVAVFEAIDPTGKLILQ
jgi:hypothetical protein